MENIDNIDNMDVQDIDYEPEIYSLMDEEGNESDFELIDELDVDGQKYFALIPLVDDEDDLIDEEQVVILKSELVDDQEMMITIESQEEYDNIGQMFFSRFRQLMDDFDDEEYFDESLEETE